MLWSLFYFKVKSRKKVHGFFCTILVRTRIGFEFWDRIFFMRQNLLWEIHWKIKQHFSGNSSAKDIVVLQQIPICLNISILKQTLLISMNSVSSSLTLRWFSRCSVVTFSIDNVLTYWAGLKELSSWNHHPACFINGKIFVAPRKLYIWSGL